MHMYTYWEGMVKGEGPGRAETDERASLHQEDGRQRSS